MAVTIRTTCVRHFSNKNGLEICLCTNPWSKHYVSFLCCHKLATLSTTNRIMTPKTPIANQLAESKSISQLRLWRALRKWLSQLYMSAGSRLVPTYLAFQDMLRPYDLICLPNNCNNYTALVKPVHPFLVMAEFSWNCRQSWWRTRHLL